MTLTLPLSSPFGASEIKARARSFLLTAWLLAASAHLLVITAVRLVQTMIPAHVAQDGLIGIENIGPVPPPPDAMRDVVPLPTPSHTATVTAPDDGDLRPVTDAPTDATASIGQGPVGDVASSGAASDGTGGVISVPQPTEVDEPIPWNEFTGEPPIAVVLPHPEYPEWAIEAGIEGVVHVEAVVEKDGLIRDARVTRSIKALDDAALTAVLHSVWRPAMNHRRPVRVRIDVPIRFSLRDR